MNVQTDGETILCATFGETEHEWNIWKIEARFWNADVRVFVPVELPGQRYGGNCPAQWTAQPAAAHRPTSAGLELRNDGTAASDVKWHGRSVLPGFSAHFFATRTGAVVPDAQDVPTVEPLRGLQVVYHFEERRGKGLRDQFGYFSQVGDQNIESSEGFEGKFQWQDQLEGYHRRNSCNSLDSIRKSYHGGNRFRFRLAWFQTVLAQYGIQFFNSQTFKASRWRWSADMNGQPRPNQRIEAWVISMIRWNEMKVIVRDWATSRKVNLPEFPIDEENVLRRMPLK